MSSALAPIALAAAVVASCRAPLEPLPPGTVDLLAPAHAPVLVAETTSVAPRDPAVLGGFHARGDDADGAWAGEGPVRVALGFIDSRPRTIEIEALGYTRDGAPPVRVAASIDGVPIGAFEAAGDAWQRHRLAVPAELSVPGRHLLELAPSRAVAPAEVDPASDDPRRLSIRVRGLRVMPAGVATPAPELSPEGVLRLPCGSRAEWPVWVPPGSSLEVEARLRRAEEAFVRVERDGGPARQMALESGRQRLPLEAGVSSRDAVEPESSGGDAPAGAGGSAEVVGSVGGAAALLVAGCSGAGGELEIRRLMLESPAPPAPRPASPPGKALLVVGAMSPAVAAGGGGGGASGSLAPASGLSRAGGSPVAGGAGPPGRLGEDGGGADGSGDPGGGGFGRASSLAAAPCSTAAPKALSCLLTGRESPAFGYPAEPVVGLVAESAEEAAEWLAATPAPAVAALVVPRRSAREAAAEVAGRVDGLSVILTRLPRGSEQIALPVEIHPRLAPGTGSSATALVGGSGEAPAVTPPHGAPADRPVGGRDQEGAPQRAELVGASQVDLLPTLYALAGADPPPVFSGTDLLPLLEESLQGGHPVTVRPAAAVWERQRSRAVRGRHVLSIPVTGEAFPRTILDRVLAGRLARRRADLAWLGTLPPPTAPPPAAAADAPAAAEPAPSTPEPGGPL